MRTLILLVLLTSLSLAQVPEGKNSNMNNEDNFKYQVEQFADLSILRYQVPGFETLTLKEKEFIYYLYEASLSGRDIFYDQNYKYNLTIRRTLEAIVNSYNGDRNSDDFNKFMTYVKRVWFSNGIHHHYSTRKFLPEISQDYFKTLVKNSDAKLFPVEKGKSVDDLVTKLLPIMFDPNVDAIRVNLDPNADLLKTSANNYYEGVTQKEVEDFYNKMEDKNDETPIWYGLNSKVVKQNGKIVEKVWKLGGMYSPAIEKIIYWLDKAVNVAGSDLQKKTLQKLIEYYKTGNLNTWDEYNILWTKDTESKIDLVHGFIEVYGDPLGHKASYEAIVSIKDNDATKRIDAISKNAQWFEDHSSIDDKFKKKNVVGISAKVINVVVESGDASPSTPIGINLPNSNWIRKEHGSKSVNLANIVHSYDMASSEGVLKEFCFSDEEINRSKQYGSLADNLHTDMHEVIGHASGQINPGVGTPKQTLKNYASTIEEARADLVALFFLPDKKLQEIGVAPSIDVAKAEYEKYIRNGLMLQLQRIKPGDNIEESHMRNRALISNWVYEKGKADNVIEKVVKDGKTYFVINDYDKLKVIFGDLLKEMQRITSEGDYNAAMNLVEQYGVKVDPELHKEVLQRYEKLNIAPYKGFINPKLTPVEQNGKIVDVKIEYPEDFTQQMLEYAKKYSFLPNNN
ncbi:MAG TPA: dihydrofolate reductase [Ignavibacteriaceae bacterium]|nr:dihydrofolate reductase [Ignavibacteriaceae bacterium]